VIETIRILIVDSDVLVRHPVAEYLRECGYSVAEASNVAEARTLLAAASLPVDILFSRGQQGFEVARWARETYPELEVVLSGSIASCASKAGELCEAGPEEDLPYDHQFLLDHIKRFVARRDNSG
jgi:CheY-like chemotaxis protein